MNKCILLNGSHQHFINTTLFEKRLPGKHYFSIFTYAVKTLSPESPRLNIDMSLKKKIAVIGLKGLPAFGGAATVGQSLIEHLTQEFEFTVYSISSHADLQFDPPGYQQYIIKNFPMLFFFGNTMWSIFIILTELLSYHYCAENIR
jgi:hypothetical protein